MVEPFLRVDRRTVVVGEPNPHTGIRGNGAITRAVPYRTPR